MRPFIRSFAALACTAAFAAGAQAQQVNLKMQATWPASLTLYENFTYFVDRVTKISGGSLKIEAMPAGQVVPAFEVLDATSKKVLDGAHSWSGYWVGKNKAAILRPGRPCRGSRPCSCRPSSRTRSARRRAPSCASRRAPRRPAPPVPPASRRSSACRRKSSRRARRSR